MSLHRTMLMMEQDSRECKRKNPFFYQIQIHFQHLLNMTDFAHEIVYRRLQPRQIRLKVSLGSHIKISWKEKVQTLRININKLSCSFRYFLSKHCLLAYSAQQLYSYHYYKNCPTGRHKFTQQLVVALVMALVLYIFQCSQDKLVKLIASQLSYLFQMGFNGFRPPLIEPKNTDFKWAFGCF